MVGGDLIAAVLEENPRTMKISRRFDDGKLAGRSLDAHLDDYIDAYADRVRGWLLDWAIELNKHEHAGFAAVLLILAFFEGFAVFYYGEDSDRKLRRVFAHGLRLVFPQLNGIKKKQADSIADRLYKLGRCGLFHLGMARPGVVLADGDYEFRVKFNGKDEASAIYIDRHKFVRAVCARFEQYVGELRDPSNSERRRHFKTAWQIVHRQ